MDAFSLLKFWKGGGGGGGGVAAGFLPETAVSSLRSSADPAGTTNTTTIVTSVSDADADDDVDADADANGDDEGPFFDLEFAVPVEDEEGEGEVEGEGDDEVSETEEEEEDGSRGDGEEGGGGYSDGTDGGEFKFTLSSGSGGDEREDPNLSLSPSDDLFFKGRLVAVEQPSSAAAEQCSAAKAAAAQFSASFLKSATKFRVFMLGLKKSKLNQAKPEKQEADSGSGDGDDKQQPPPPQQKNTFTVKFKVEEVPIISLFTRDSSSRNSSSSSSSSSSSKKQNGDEPAVSDEKRFLMMQKYLKKVKPLYVRVSRRYGEKLRFSGQLSLGSAPSSAARSTTEKDQAEKTEPPAKSQKQGSLNISIPAGLKVVRKHLGKSRSASSVTPPPQTSTASAVAPVTSKRRDDSLLQQQDGIQSAILHCKRSFNSSRDGDASVLPRSVSDPSSYEK